MAPNIFALLRRISIALAVLGIIVAGYLAVLYLTNTDTLCSTGCDLVRQSRYSHVAGIPVPIIGILGYLAILAILILEETKGPLSGEGPILVFGLGLIGTAYSAYLTYLEVFVIRGLCPYCLASAVLMLAIFAIAVPRMVNSLRV